MLCHGCALRKEFFFLHEWMLLFYQIFLYFVEKKSVIWFEIFFTSLRSAGITASGHAPGSSSPRQATGRASYGKIDGMTPRHKESVFVPHHFSDSTCG